MLEARDLHFSVPVRGEYGVFRRRRNLDILKGVSLDLAAGETLGLVGESGSGKTTLGRLLLRLLRPTMGTLRFEGRDITALSPPALRPLRARMQMIFQDPQSSLNPRHRVGDIVTQPLRAFGKIASRDEGRREAAALFERVGLQTRFLDRYPHELSGGQRQRVGIARAIAAKPALIVADEIVSGLDVSAQARILKLLDELRRELRLALIFISHDLSVVRVLCQRILVLRRGEAVETGPVERIFASPAHPYTRRLLDSIPLPDVDPAWLDREETAEP